GHDQHYWGNRVDSTVAAERREAATALASLLKSSRSRVRVLVIEDLGECKPGGREIALGALVAFARDEAEDERLRWKAEYGIGIMFFQHVFGDIGLEVDREAYGKKIVAHGWNAVAREVADTMKIQAK